MLVPWPCLRGCINAACEIVTVAQVRSDLIVENFATRGVAGRCRGSDVQMCDPDARKVRPRSA